MFKFLAFFILSSVLATISYAKTDMSYDKEPITASTWAEIDIAWDNPYDNKKDNAAQLIRPITYANKYGLFYGNTNVKMNLTEFGVPNAKVRVTAIKQITPLQVLKIKDLYKNQRPIIGLYQHEVKDVRTYTFIDTRGRESRIHATPNHRFYVLGRGYTPLSNIKPTMNLVDSDGQSISLVCSDGSNINCGIPYRKGKKTWVHNVEVYQQHQYFVGKQHVLAHNPCGKLDEAKEAFGEDLFDGLVNKKVVFVDGGNTGRSLIAEHLARIEMQNNALSNVTVKSRAASLNINEIYPEEGTFQQLLDNDKINIENQMARGLTRKDLDEADYVLSMQAHHLDIIRNDFGQEYNRKLHILSEFSGRTAADHDILDPHDGIISYSESYHQIKDSIPGVLKRIKKSFY